MNTIEQLADAIVSAREFCGNEREALADAAANLKVKLTHNMRQQAFQMAENIWRGFQLDAGVTRPIDQFERSNIERVFRKA